MPLENNKVIDIHQAYYGEVNRSHGCLISSIDDERLNSFLTSFSDKPYPIPVGIVLDTYYSSTVFSNYFIVTKTIPDDNASRPGMVFTHALIISLKDTEQITGLGEIFSYFVDDIPKVRSVLLSRTYQGSCDNRSLTVTSYPAYLQKSVEFLIKGVKVAFFGNVESFLNAIIVIWDGLPIQLRKHLTFGIGFSLEDITNKREPLLYFQKNLNNRIAYPGSVSEDDVSNIEIENSVEKLVLGHQEVNEFNKFLVLLNVQLGDFNQLAIADKAYHLYVKLDELHVNDLRQFIRLLALLSPCVSDGIALKKLVIGKLGDFIENGQEYKVKALRNISLKGFQNAESELSDKITNFIINQFTSNLRFDPIVINEMIAITTDEQESDWWHTSVSNGLAKALALSSALDNIWLLLKDSKTRLKKFMPLIPTGQKQEEALIKHFPNTLTPDNANLLKYFFQERSWYTLYARTSLAYQEQMTAFKEQLFLERKLELTEAAGVLLIAENIPDEKLLDFNLIETDDKALSLLVSRMVKSPALLKEMDLNNNRWLKIWDSFLKENGKFELGINDIRAKTSQLYQLLSKKVDVPERIISLFSQSDYADLSSYPNRDVFWNVVPVAYKDQFLLATANGYAKYIANNSSSSADTPEPELIKIMTSDVFVSKYLSQYRADLEAAIVYYETFSSLKDSFLSDYINWFPTTIPDFTSARLGNIVLNRKYKQTASAIFNKAKNNRSFRIALNTCKPLLSLSIFDRVLYSSLFGETLNEEMAFEALFELLKQLYKTGPEEEKIWERAGGDDTKLVNQNSREENWRRALHLAKHGGGGKHLSIKSLLKEMQEDFGGNLILKELQQYFKNKA